MIDPNIFSLKSNGGNNFISADSALRLIKGENLILL